MLTALLLMLLSEASGEPLQYQDRAAALLIDKAPAALDSYDAETGRFGSGIWIVQDQNVMFPLAVLWALDRPDNPHHHSADLLEVIMDAGDALIDDADKNGQWEFRKKDGSTWGKIHMPWTCSRWVRAFAIIQDAMPTDRRTHWAQWLTLIYDNIARDSLKGVHNIPAHHAMGLYVAGQALDKPVWREQAREFLRKVADSQRDGGYWSEGAGPVVTYNFVYTDALGTYYALSGDEAVLPNLEKAARFHRRFTYPNGHMVETIDERNPYHEGIRTGNVGFTFSPEGRAWLQQQWQAAGFDTLSSDNLASLIRYGEEGAVPPPAAEAPLFILEEGGIGRAATRQEPPWFLCLSAYYSDVPKSRWLQDRQNLVSIYHDRAGLAAGGGNTKLQPAWSTFTVGDMDLLRHEKGDTNPDFLPEGDLYHVPSEAKLVTGGAFGLDLQYGPEQCTLRIALVDDNTLRYRVSATAESGLPVYAHITLLPHVGETLATAGGKEVTTGADTWSLMPADVGGAITWQGCRWELPDTASVHWPARRHNPYAKAGESKLGDARIEIRIPLDKAHPEQTVTLTVQE